MPGRHAGRYSPQLPGGARGCACGNSFITRSTRGDFQVDVCGACHPFYTGTQKLIDTAGRVDRFRKRYEKKGAMAAKAAEARPPRAMPRASAHARSEAQAAPRARAIQAARFPLG